MEIFMSDCSSRHSRRKQARLSPKRAGRRYHKPSSFHQANPAVSQMAMLTGKRRRPPSTSP